jgi:hypothetical protein
MPQSGRYGICAHSQTGAHEVDFKMAIQMGEPPLDRFSVEFYFSKVH